jgi:hypothetical protein
MDLHSFARSAGWDGQTTPPFAWGFGCAVALTRGELAGVVTKSPEELHMSRSEWVDVITGRLASTGVLLLCPCSE